MKKISIILVMLIIFVAGILSVVPVMAVDTVSVNISAKNQVKVGENVSVTVSWGSKKASMVQFTLKYDKDKFEYVTNSIQKDKYDTGSNKFIVSKTEQDISNITFTFKALKKAEEGATFSISKFGIALEPGTKANVSKGEGSVKVKIISKTEDPTPGVDKPTNGGSTENKPKPDNPGTDNGNEADKNKPTNGGSSGNTGNNGSSNNKKPNDNKNNQQQEPTNNDEQNEQPPVENDVNNVVDNNTVDNNTIGEVGENNTNNTDTITDQIQEEQTEEKKEFNIWKYVKYILIFIVIIGVIIIIIRANKETY